MQLLTCCGMDESDSLCLQTEAIALMPIELVADDGTAKTIGMRTVHAQLMRPSRMRPQCQQ